MFGWNKWLVSLSTWVQKINRYYVKLGGNIESLARSNNSVCISKMIADETGETHQSVKDILRNTCFKTSRTTCCAI